MFVIDNQGFRANVAMVICNRHGQVLWCQRAGINNAWQFPQGGIHKGESTEQALYRELAEEVGLKPSDVNIIGSSRGWLRYRLPRRLQRTNSKPLCIGQKQRWYLLSLQTSDTHIDLNSAPEVEFSQWRWVSYWYPIEQVVDFKRNVYRRALKALAPAHYNYIRSCGAQPKTTEALNTGRQSEAE